MSSDDRVELGRFVDQGEPVDVWLTVAGVFVEGARGEVVSWSHEQFRLAYLVGPMYDGDTLWQLVADIQCRILHSPSIQRRIAALLRSNRG